MHSFPSSYKREVELLSGYKEQTQVLEAKLCGYSANEAKLQELQQVCVS